jgi:hypothetical protein
VEINHKVPRVTLGAKIVGRTSENIFGIILAIRDPIEPTANRQWPASHISTMVTHVRVTHHTFASCHDSGATGLPHLRPFHGRIPQSSAEFQSCSDILQFTKLPPIGDGSRTLAPSGHGPKFTGALQAKFAACPAECSSIARSRQACT